MSLADELERALTPAEAAINRLNRDYLGELVREAWVEWAMQQPDPKPSWLLPYRDLCEPDKEADRQIGVHLARIGTAAFVAENRFLFGRILSALRTERKEPAETSELAKWLEGWACWLDQETPPQHRRADRLREAATELFSLKQSLGEAVEVMEQAWKQGFCKGDARSYALPPTVAELDTAWRKSKMFEKVAALTKHRNANGGSEA